MGRLRDPAIALSLANLLFFEVWKAILPGSPVYYHVSKPPPAALFIAVIVDVLLLAFVFWAVACLARRLGSIFFRRIVQWLFLFVFLIPVDSVRKQIPGFSDPWLVATLGSTAFSVVVYTLGGLAIMLFWKWTDRFVHGMATILLLLAPFVMVTFFQAGSAVLAPRWVLSDFAESSAPLLKTSETSSRPRVLWLVFDELDYRMTFVDRPESVKMPELDRLRTQALYAANAYPPAAATALSIPALLIGRFVSKAAVSSVRELMVTFDTAEQAVRWSSQPNVFSRARGMGFNSAAVGWYHPYCRIMGGSLAACSTHGGLRWDLPPLTIWEMFRYAVNPSWMPTVWRHIPWQKKLRTKTGFDRSALSFQSRKKRTLTIHQYLNMLSDAKEALANPALDFVFVHWSIPHPNGIYDRTKKQLAWDGAKRSYLDNLELVDNTIGELRRFMESSRMWQSTTVIVSADHSYRTFKWTALTKEERQAIGGKFDARIPFLVKLTGQERPVVYESTFNTVLTHDLVLALLQGAVKDPDELVEWLKEHGIDRRPANAPTDSPADDE